MESDSNYEPNTEKSESEQEKAEQEEKIKVKKSKKAHTCNFPGCNAAFLRPYRLQQHLNVHMDERPHKCTFEGCDKAYSSSSHLKRHLQTHETVATTYKCQFCSVNISTLSNLKRHYNRAHNSERELFCQECNVFFRKKSRYEEHLASHKNESKYKCDKCGRSYLTHLKLKKHQETHRIKIYKCPVKNCSEVFEKWAVMIKHKRKDHFVDYVCKTCGKAFSYISQMNAHRPVHVDDRPAIPCPYTDCKHLFYFQRNLTHHIQAKHNGQKFECDACGLKLSTKQKIKEHIIKIHVNGKKPFKRKAQAPRKDIGQAKKSVLSHLTGIHLGAKSEMLLMQRKPTALLRDKAVDESLSEDDRASDASAKGA